MVYKEYKNDAYNLYTVKTNKFKTCELEIVFKSKITKEEITIKNFLIDCLSYTSKKYIKRKNIVEKLEDLYDAYLSVTNTRSGQLELTNFTLEFLDPQYCEKNYLKEIIDFLMEIIFNPNVIDNEFDATTFKIVRESNLAKINSNKDNAKRYALKRAVAEADGNSVASFYMVGYKEQLDKITPEKLYQYYLKFINETECDIYVIGNLDMEKINLLIDEKFRNMVIKDKISFEAINLKERKWPKKVVEKGNYNQASLVMVCNLKNLTFREKTYVMNVYNYIMGDGSLTNKLADNLREKNSLCYSTHSLYQKYDNAVLLYAGIEPKDYKFAVSLMKKVFREMQKGDFTLEEVETAKLNLINNLKLSLDNNLSILGNYLYHNIAKTPLIEEYLENMATVTKEEVVALANKIKINTIYMLEPGGQDEGN